jgi:hypothetical protein
MSFPSQDRRADEKLGEKLGLILSRVGSLSTRLNSLAWQYAIFFTLAIVIAAGAAVFAGAYVLSPLAFLIFTPLIAIGAGLGIVSAIRAAWRMRAGAARAAMIADDRAELKDRLSTIVAFADKPNHGTLWSYLVEDTLGYQDEFAPARIERRRVSRAIYPFAGAIMLAALALPISRLKHASPIAPGDTVNDLTVDLDDLHLRAAEPGDESGMQVSADPETMRRLQDKLARENPAGGDAAGNSLNQLVNRARDMAGHFQSKLTGQPPPSRQRLNLRLADAGTDQQHDPIHRAPDAKKNRHGDVAGQFKQDQPRSKNELNLPRQDDSRPPNKWPSSNRNGENGTELGSGKDNPTNQDGAIDRSIQQGGENGSNGGEAHGIGADPDSLFGAPAASKLGTEGFEIAIEARPIDHGAKGAGHAYVPPKVRTPLNTSQEPDEPVARAAVPAEDRTTIKRVFER